MITPLSSIQGERYLLTYEGSYYDASLSLVELIRELQSNQTEDEAIISYIKKQNGKYSSDQIRAVIDKYLLPIFEQKKKRSTFLYEKELFSAKIIDKFSDKFKFLFYPKYMISILSLAIILDIYFFTQTEGLLLFNNVGVNIYMIIGLLIFILASSFFHELGHASACKFFNIQHGGIGFGLYLNFPVLYTNVTEVWKLNRKERCVVNIAGVYFQSYWIILLLVLFFITKNDILRYLILIMNFGFIMTLNPFFKFDGYWIASDILGIPNLRVRSLEFLNYIYRYIRRKEIVCKPFLLQIKPIARYAFLIYAVVVNLFMGVYFFYIIPSFFYKLIYTFPEEINDLVLYISNDMMPPFVLIRNIGMQMLLSFLICYFLYKMIKKYVK